MESRRDSTLCSPCFAGADDDDFLSRYVNLGLDTDSSEWNYQDDYLSNEYDLLKLFSREQSREIIDEDVKNPRKSSLEKPVGFLMQLKPRVNICENFKSSRWGKFLSSEKRVRENSSQSYLEENTDCNDKVNIEKNEDKDNGKQSHCQTFASGCKRSKSVNDVFKESNCEVENVLDQKQQRNQSLKQSGKEENTCGIKRAAPSRLNKQFSVYSQNFELNTRFLSKSHYHISHWKPAKSRVRSKETITKRKDPNLDLVIEKRMAFKQNGNVKETELEERRQKFDTDKSYRAWVWEPENSPSNKLQISGKADRKQQNSGIKSLKMFSSSEFVNGKIKSQEKSKERKKIERPTRQLSQGDAPSNTISLPAISSPNILPVIRQKSPHKLGNFPCISTDSLMKQYKKYHDEFIKQGNKNSNKL